MANNSESYQSTGTLIKKGEIELKGASKFAVRAFAIEIAGNYPQFIEFALTQDRCSLLDDYQLGQEVKVLFNLRGRKWEDKIFNSLQCWRIESAGQQQTPPPQAEAFPAAQPAVVTTQTAGFGDDLPF